MCFQGLKVKKVPTVIHDIRGMIRSQVQIRGPHVESESSIDEDNIFAISPPIVKGTSWNFRDLNLPSSRCFR